MAKYVILGHENPDVDSIVSGYLLEKLMQQKGYDILFIIPDKKIDETSVKICQEYGLHVCNYQKNLGDFLDCKFILVDHHKRKDVKNVVAVVDHHPTMEKINVPYYQNEKKSSTSCLICQGENESYFSKTDIKLALLAAFVDTASFHSTKTCEKDVVWAREMCEKYSLDYEKLYQAGLCLTDVSDLKKACFNGLKKYEIGSYKIASSYVQVLHFEDLDLKMEKMLDYLREYFVENGLDVYLFLVHDMTIFKTTVYDLRENELKIEKYEEYAARGETILPKIEKECMDGLNS